MPTPHEQGERLIRWIGKNLDGPGDEIEISYSNVGGFIDSIDNDGFNLRAVFAIAADAGDNALDNFRDRGIGSAIGALRMKG